LPYFLKISIIIKNGISNKRKLKLPYFLTIFTIIKNGISNKRKLKSRT
jgi:hypothetical protein